MPKANDAASSGGRLGARVSRRRVLQLRGLLAVGTVALPPLLAGCGGDSSPAEAPAAGASAAPTLPRDATAGPVTVKAHEIGNVFVFDVDRQAVPAGDVTFNFRNNGKLTHGLMVYPVQDIAAMESLKRKGKSVDESDYIKGMVAKAEEIEPGKTATFTRKLTPGFYELACHAGGQNPDGSTFLHFEKGQAMTLAATGPAGPAASLMNPSSTIAVEMVAGTGDLKDSWLFVPDRLIARAGDVTFNISNKMDMEHNFVVYPSGDVSTFINHRFAGGEGYGEIGGEGITGALAAGKSASATKKLAPGWWTAACFAVSRFPDGTAFVHRDKGERFTFLAV